MTLTIGPFELSWMLMILVAYCMAVWREIEIDPKKGTFYTTITLILMLALLIWFTGMIVGWMELEK